MLRLRSQHLVGDRTTEPEQVGTLVERIGGIQAQDSSAAERGIWARTSELTAARLEQERVEGRSFVRTWAMRGTLHLMPRSMLAASLSAFGLRFIRTTKSRYKQLGLTEPVMDQAVELIDMVLSERGPLTRGQIADALAAHQLPHEGQITFHLIRRAAFLGHLCYGPELEGETAFVRLADWLGGPLEETPAEQAQARMAEWYLRGFGPVGTEDFASWSGLPISIARQALDGLQAELLELNFGDQRLWMHAECADWLDDLDGRTGEIALLPAFDSYLLAYRDRALSVPELHAGLVHPGGGIIRATLLLDGMAAGIWSARRKGPKLSIELTPFAGLSRGQRAGFERLATDLGRFHEMDAEVDFTDPF